MIYADDASRLGANNVRWSVVRPTVLLPLWVSNNVGQLITGTSRRVSFWVQYMLTSCRAILTWGAKASEASDVLVWWLNRLMGRMPEVGLFECLAYHEEN